jgi:hypothetical protein
MGVKKPFDIDRLITKGALVKEDCATQKKEWTHLCLRISTDMIDEINRALDTRVGITRTGWILEAIHEKLKKDIE